MAGERILAALHDACLNEQQVVETEHLMKALLEDCLVNKIFTTAGLDNESILQATVDFISLQPKVNHETSELKVGKHLRLVIENAVKHQKEMGDNSAAVEHLVLAFHSDERFGRRLFKNLQLSKKDLKAAVGAVRGDHKATDERFGWRLFENLQLSKKDLKAAIGAVLGYHKATDKNPDKKYDVLDKYGRDMTKLARCGKLHPVVGRIDEMKRCIQILSKCKKNNPIIIDEPGVGKTAIVEGLAQRIVRKDVPESLLNTKLISLDMGSLVAGTKYSGEFEERWNAVLNKVSASNGKIILFIDEIHTIVGAGATGGSMDASNLMKLMLARGELRCIGATTLMGYKKYIEKDPALKRRVQPVLCVEPSVTETISILCELREVYERYHGVKISNSAIDSAARLADKYIRDRFFPDKAIDLIDEAAGLLKEKITTMCGGLGKIQKAISELKAEKLSLATHTDEASKKRSRKLDQDLNSLEQKQKELTEDWDREKSLIDRMQSINKDAERELNLNRDAKLKCRNLVSFYRQLEEIKKNLHDLRQSRNSLLPEEITGVEIAEAISNWTGIPLSNLQQFERDKLSEIEQILHQRVVGQDIAVKSVAEAILHSREGFSDPDRPIAKFMFMGPTGVGKTELAKALAAYLNIEDALVWIDMREYMERHEISRLVGAPPGYAGYEEGGHLTKPVSEHMEKHAISHLVRALPGYTGYEESGQLTEPMSEHMERNAISRLVGALPRYMGYEEGGQLTEPVRRRPYSVVLFDEIEKAHHDVFNILLRLLDNGRITDSRGTTVSFTNCIIIITSNIGSDYILENFSKMDDNKDVIYELMREKVIELAMQNFRQEFMGRIDDHIIFLPLDYTQICKITEIQIEQACNRFKQRNFYLHYTKEALELIGTFGFDPRSGARQVKRVIHQLVEMEVVRQISRGKFKKGDSIMVDVDFDASSTVGDLTPKKRLHIKRIESESTLDAIVAED